MRDFARDPDNVFRAQLAGLRQNVRAAFGVKNHLRLAVAIAKIDEDDAALIAVRIDPAAKRDLRTDVLRPQLAASMGAKQGETPNVKLELVAVCARNRAWPRRLDRHCIRRPRRV